MQYYQKINISNLVEIQQYYSYFIDTYDNHKGFKQVHEFNTPMYDPIAQSICGAVTAVTGKSHDVAASFLFVQQPNDIDVLYHVDGNTTERINCQNWALNIPLYNCDRGVMEWAEGDHHLVNQVTPTGATWLSLNWISARKKVESVIIDTPMIVRVNKPHRVSNYKNATRMILSFRLNPDIFAP